jgi:hypothetical protein
MTFQDKLNRKLQDITEERRVVLGQEKTPEDWSLYKYLTGKLGFETAITKDGLVATIGPKAQMQFTDANDMIIILNTYTGDKMEVPTNRVSSVVDAITKMLGAEVI